MSRTRTQSRRQRCSSTTYDASAIAVAPSVLLLSTELFTPSTHEEYYSPRSARRSSSAGDLNYTYSFRRSEHTNHYQNPPSYDSLYSPPPPSNVPAYSLSFSRCNKSDSSPMFTPVSSLYCHTSNLNVPTIWRSISSPTSPVVSPLSSNTPIAGHRARIHRRALSSQEHTTSPIDVELPSPFGSPLFYWNGQSRQELAPMERIHKAQMEDLSLMSPFGSPNFYWDGVSRQEAEEESSLDKVKKAWSRLSSQRLGSARERAPRCYERTVQTVWDDTRRCWVLLR